MSIDWLVNDIFVDLDRGYLLEQKNRQQLVDYLNTVIEDFSKKNNTVDGNGQDECKQVVQAILQLHQESKLNNSQVCLMGKYHDLLYVAAKLCYQWNLQDTPTICTLLTAIYSCEKTLEKLFECAIFGTKVTQLISGWRSDYSTRDENIKACRYFIEHSTKGSFFVSLGTRQYNLVDVPMTSYEKLSPLKVAVKAEKWDVTNLLMSCGALTYVPIDDVDYEKYALFELFVEKLEKLYGCSDSLMESFRMFLRSVPSISSVCKLQEEYGDEWLAMTTFLNELTKDDFREPRSLKHLARCSARRYLSECHLLPASLSNLLVPASICKYIDLTD